MRRAITRCSSSLPRNLLYSSARAFRLSQVRNAVRIAPGQVLSQVRNVHRSSQLKQYAAAQEASSAEDQPQDVITTFAELGEKGILHRNITDTLTREMGLETMTEVQKRTINEALRGDDIIAQAKTGTGKTLAFLIPILQNIIARDPDLALRSNSRRGPRTTADDIRAVIISPTRELAEQIAAEAKKVVSNTGLIVQTAVGGTQKSAGLRAIQQQGCHILVGTPGRLNDLFSDPYTGVQAPDLSALVFDEADRLLEVGFWPTIQDIMRRLPSPAQKDRQTLMFSATVPQEVVSVVRDTLKPGFLYVKCVGDNEDPTHPNVRQRLVRLNGMENSLPALTEICARSLEASKQPGGKPFKAIVYFNSTAEVRLAAAALTKFESSSNGEQQERMSYRGFRNHPWEPCRIVEIHAKLAQAARTKAADTFRRCESGILLSSDVTARGMDFPYVTHVIQMGLPMTRDQYIHRVGRTARAGREGEGWLILNPLEYEEARYRLKNLPIENDDSLACAKLDMTKEAQVDRRTGELLSMYQNSLRKVDPREKADVYRAQLGIHQWFRQKQTLIDQMNQLAKFGWGLKDPPMLAPGLAQRLGLTRMRGVNIGHDDSGESFGERDGGRYGGGAGGGSRYGSGGGGRSFGDRDDRRGGGFGGDRGGFGGERGGFGNRDDRGSSFGGRSGGFGGDRGGGGGRYGSRDSGRNSYGGGDSFGSSRDAPPRREQDPFGPR